MNFSTTPGNDGYNWIIDYDGTIYELTGWDMSSWHATYLNRRSWAIGLAQPTVDDVVTPAQHASLRWLLHELHNRKGVPLRRVFDENEAGITQHMDTQQGKSYGKSDVGYRLDWSKLL